MALEFASASMLVSDSVFVWRGSIWSGTIAASSVGDAGADADANAGAGADAGADADAGASEAASESASVGLATAAVALGAVARLVCLYTVGRVRHVVVPSSFGSFMLWVNNAASSAILASAPLRRRLGGRAVGGADGAAVVAMASPMGPTGASEEDVAGRGAEEGKPSSFCVVTALLRLGGMAVLCLRACVRVCVFVCVQ